MAFVQRQLDFTITLGSGNFGLSGTANTVKATGLRASVHITKAGQPSADLADMRIWGLTQDIMNQATDLGKPLSRPRNNIVTVSAGDPVNGKSVVFSGMIITAYGDFSDLPNACLSITAQSNQIAAAQPVDALSYPGGADAVVIANQIAQSMGKSLVNWGVSGIQLSNPYFAGTAIQQMMKLHEATGIHWATSDGQPLEIWPAGGARGGEIPLISPTTGLVGYPEYCDLGVSLKTLYMPGLVFGGDFMLQTSIKQAAGKWQNIGLELDLESEMPGGQWFALVKGTRGS